MKLSIVTIAKNEEKTIGRTILSVINQSALCDFEYIVIDGASSDKTLDVIKKYENKISRIISKADSGIYDAFNKGILNAKGEYILFLNAGDELYDDKVVEKILPKLDCPLVFGNIKVINGANSGFIEYDNFLDEFELFYKSLPHGASFIKKENFKEFGMYDATKKIAADWEWFLKYLNSGGVYKYVNMPVSIFYAGGVSTNINSKKMLKKERKEIRDKYYSTAKQILYKIILKILGRNFILKHVRKILSVLGVVKIYENYYNN